MALVPAASAQRFNGGAINQPLTIDAPGATAPLLEVVAYNDQALAFSVHDPASGTEFVSADTSGNFSVQDALGGAVTLNGNGLTVAPSGIGGVLTATSAGVLVGTDTLGLGFYAHAPVMRPTGVAVTAAGIHAALVSLGLITA